VDCFPVYHEGLGYRWESLDYLQTRYQEFQELPEDEQLEYQQESPEAEYITGYNTDTFADESIDACKAVWDTYCDTCADEEREPNWQEYLDLCWEDFDYQCCHTWLRVTNINLTDEQVKQAAYDSNSATMQSVLGLD
jgi:hypothetical protein